MTESSNGKWDKVSEWRGYVVRALEDIDKELISMNGKLESKAENSDISLLRNEIGGIKNDIKDLSNNMVNIKVRVAEIGAVSGIILTVITSIIIKFFGL